MARKRNETGREQEREREREYYLYMYIQREESGDKKRGCWLKFEV